MQKKWNRFLKRALACVLVVVMTLTAAPLGLFSDLELLIKSSAAEKDFGDYDNIPSYNAWRADCYSSYFDATFQINDSPSYSNIYYNSLNSDAAFKAGLISWDTICVFTSPSEATEIFTKREYYDALLLDLLSDNNDSSLLLDVVDNYDSIKDSIHNSYTKYIFSITKTILGEDELKNTEELTKLLSMSPEYYKAEYLMDGEKIGKKVLVGTKYQSSVEIVDNICTIFDYADTLETAIINMCKYVSINEAKDGTEEILNYIINDKNNPSSLRNAAYDCLECFDAGFSGVLAPFVNGVGNEIVSFAIEELLDEVYDQAWDKLSEFYPGAKAILMLAKGTKILMKFFDVDAIAGAFYNLEATVNLENALIRCVNNFKSKYLENPDETAAINYLRSISMYENMAQTSFDASVDILKAYIQTPIANAFWKDKTDSETGETQEGRISQVNEVIKTITTFKKNKINNFNTFENATQKVYLETFCPNYDLIIDQTVADLPIPGWNETILPTKQIAKSDLSYEKNSDDTITIKKYIGRKGKYECVAIPSEIDGLPVKSIAPRAFYGESFYRIIIPGCVETIGSKAFWGHMYLRNIVILGENPSIGDRAFGWEIKSGGVVFLDEKSNNTNVYGESDSTVKKFAEANEGFYFDSIAKAPGWFVEPENYVYHVYTAGDLLNVADNITYSEHLENYIIKLEHNLYLGPDDWTPIGVASDKYFAGSFDGNGYKISTFRFAGEFKATDGFFGYVKGSDNFIRNFSIESYIYKTEHWVDYNSVGSVIGRLDVDNSTFTMENIICNGSIVLSCGMGTMPPIGGIIGVVKEKNHSNVRIRNVYATFSHLQGLSIFDDVTLGGIVGIVEGATDDDSNIELENCSARCAYYTSGKGYTESCVGGLIGRVNNVNLRISHSSSEGSMSLNSDLNYCSGMVGCMTSNKKVQFENCFVSVIPSGHIYGGLFCLSNTGKADLKESYIKNCVVTADSSETYSACCAFSSYNTAYTNQYIPVENCYYNSDRFGAASMNHSLSSFSAYEINSNNLSNVRSLSASSMQYPANYKLDFYSEWISRDSQCPRLRIRYDVDKRQSFAIPLYYCSIGATGNVSSYSTNEKIAELNKERVTVKKIGLCRIRIETDNGFERTIDICFSKNTDYKYDLIDDNSNKIRLIKAYNFGKKIILPEEIDGYQVTEFIESFFDPANGTASCEEVFIPKTINNIPLKAFNQCFALKQIHVDSENKSFSDKNGILYSADEKKLLRCPIAYESEVKVSDITEEISPYAFYECNVTDVELPQCLNTIGTYAFYCSKIESIDFPQGLTTIDSFAFNGCDGLKEVSIPEGVTFIGSLAFRNCDYLTTVNYNAISCECTDNALYGMFGIGAFGSGVSSIHVGLGVKTLPTRIFAGTNISSIEIPYTVKTIGKYAFSQCKSLTDVYYSSTKEAWDRITIESSNTPLTNATIHYGDIPIPHVHEYNPVVTKVATCTETGVITYTCDCGDTYTETISATEHSESEWIVDKSPDCVNSGLKHTECLVCGSRIQEEVTPALGHTYGEYVVTTVPTCTEDGYTTYTCSACGDTYQDDIVPATGHTAVTDPAVAATCTETGLTEGSHCSVCGEVLTAQEKTPTLGHTYGEYVVTVQPTCTKAGVETQTCSVCGDEQTISAAALGHTEVTDPAKRPTCTETGLTEGSHCSVCGEVLTAQEGIPALGHTDTNADGKCDNCGETMEAVKTCTCNCHKGGFSGFIYKITRIFWKLFRINKTCACGMAHY